MQTYIDQIVRALVGLLVVVVLGVITMLRAKFSAWLDARTTAAQRDTLHKLAQEAAALAEVSFGIDRKHGNEKLNAAITYVTDRVASLGIKVSPQSIEAAIEKAVQDYNVKIKGGGNV